MKSETTDKAKILLLSGYDAASHYYWRKILEQRLNCFQWVQVALPDRYFSWRIRGNSLSFAFQYKKILQQDYDCLIVTSMVDLASLRGFVPNLSLIPTIVYFHENQFAYPESTGLKRGDNTVNAQLTSIYSALCADKVIFNSKYNRQTFFKGANQLLKKLPDGVPKHLLQETEKKAVILAVPIVNNESLLLSGKGDKKTALELVWNHRWEYDKQPEVLFSALAMLKESGYSFKLHILGQSFRQIPECFEKARVVFKDEIKTWGFQPKKRYLAILAQSDIVISTALHDFQGLSLLEAINCDCFPIAPNRVVYPEYLNEDNLYQVSGSMDEAPSLYRKLVNVFERIQPFILQNEPLPTAMLSTSQFLEENLLVKYEALIKKMIERRVKSR